MSNYPVTEKKQQALLAKMAQLNIQEKDLIEKFIRSSAPGGQHVNKTSTCVVLKHLPTNLEVRCQQDRSQSMNRFLARRLLVDKIEAHILKKKSTQQQRIEKIRRQKRKRSKRAKEKLLADKHHQAKKKQLRVTPNDREL